MQDDAQRQNSIIRLKDHVVQLEALVIFLVILNVALFLLSQIKLPFSVWLIPCLFLVLLRPIMRVMNPTDETRNRLVWAAVGAGVLGPIGGAIDVASFGLTAGQATLAGMAIGRSIGAAIGDRIEHLRKSNALLERGEAFDYLYQFKNKNRELANPKLVSEALDHEIAYYDKNEEGRKWHAPEDLYRFAKKGR